MQVIHFVTTNKGKITSLNRDFRDSVIEVVPVNIDIPEPRSDETREIAYEKVMRAYELIKKPCVAQDGGFYIPSLNGFPRAFVNFAVETIGLEGILKLVEGKDRSCEFRDTLAFYDGQMEEPIFFETISKGRLAEEPRGELHEYNWGELHKIFIPEGHEKTFAEMTAEEMDAWSRARQLEWCGRKFAKWYQGRLG